MRDFPGESESCRSLCIVLIKVCVAGLENTGSWCGVEGLTGKMFVLSGGSVWKPVLDCPLVPFLANVLSFSPELNIPRSSSWGWPLVWVTPVSHLKILSTKTLPISFMYEKTLDVHIDTVKAYFIYFLYFILLILHLCKQCWQFFVALAHRCQTNVEIQVSEKQFGELVPDPVVQVHCGSARWSGC